MEAANATCSTHAHVSRAICSVDNLMPYMLCFEKEYTSTTCTCTCVCPCCCPGCQDCAQLPVRDKWGAALLPAQLRKHLTCLFMQAERQQAECAALHLNVQHCTWVSTVVWHQPCSCRHQCLHLSVLACVYRTAVAAGWSDVLMPCLVGVFFFPTQVAEHPLPLAPDTDADAWLVALASSPLSEVQDPRRSSVPSAAAAAAALQGKREVSPRCAYTPARDQPCIQLLDTRLSMTDWAVMILHIIHTGRTCKRAIQQVAGLLYMYRNEQEQAGLSRSC